MGGQKSQPWNIQFPHQNTQGGIRMWENARQAGAELCQAQICLVGCEIRFELNYFYQNEF